MKVELRKPLVSDAKRYCEILDDPGFCHMPVVSVTVKGQKEYIRNIKKEMKAGTEYTFVVMANGKHVGGVGFDVRSSDPHICELGYFIDRKYWGKGIATKAVALLEKYIAENTNIVRIEVSMAKKNIGSRQVAIKSGYKKEGLMRKSLKVGDKYYDCYLYAKVFD